jgi:DNA repair protein RecN (Recombination protein N)
MVFDEVDAGVGGAAALALGRALREVAEGRQVMVVTHLAQVAAAADRQISVHKATRDGRTVTGASVLSADGRLVELSRMLSGHPDSATARAHAEELLALVRASTPSTTAGAGGG